MFSIIIYFENNLHFINKEDILDKKEVNKRFDNNSDSGYLYNAILKNAIIGCYQDKNCKCVYCYNLENSGNSLTIKNETK